MTPTDSILANSSLANPVAGIDVAVAREASAWLVLLMSGEATGDDRDRFAAWCAAHPEHARAWQHIEAVNSRLRGVPTQIALATLSPAARNMDRRRFVKGLSMLVVASGAGLLARQSTPWRQWTAAYRADIGKQREFALEDGGQLVLNTGSAADVTYSATRRLVQLRGGEALIATAADPRPFMVEMAAGMVRAVGTRFVVREDPDRSYVAVLAGAVELSPAAAGGRKILVPAGQAASFTQHEVGAMAAVSGDVASWTQGIFIAEDMRLDAFVANLARYRRGHLTCDPAVAALLVSGVFPINDTDNVLAALADALPVRVRFRTRFWATLEHA